MNKWVANLLAKEKAKRKVPLEAKKLNNNYYLYHSTTRWDKKEKKNKKVTNYIGRMTPKGVIEKGDSHSIRSIYEYGSSQLLYELSQEIIEPLNEAFPYRWEDILACAMVKTIEPLPLKMIKTRWEKLHISEDINASLSPNTISNMLREIGMDYASQKDFFNGLIANSKIIAFDLSSIFSQSVNLKYAEKGHNADHLYLHQINLMLFFSIDKQLPVLLKPLPGSVRDIKALKTVIDEINSKDAILVLDRGLASYKLPVILDENLFNFILPLRRNFKLINYNMKLDNTFPYRNRGIKWSKKKRGKYLLYLFEDVKLKAEEETTFIQLMANGKRKKGAYQMESKKFGKIAILSNLDMVGEEIYLMYKDRVDIEVAFDALKNELENDKTCLNDEDAIRGYFFISFISLYLYYRILNLLRKNNLVSKVSVNEVLLEFSKVYEIHIGKKKKLSEIPDKVVKLAKSLGLDIFPKNLGS
ncbi:MAG: transposase [Flavobacteriaceae bacterium]|nr:transposase [Flavobacteriaceae bacterium]